MLLKAGEKKKKREKKNQKYRESLLKSLYKHFSFSYILSEILDALKQQIVDDLSSKDRKERENMSMEVEGVMEEEKEDEEKSVFAIPPAHIPLGAPSSVSRRQLWSLVRDKVDKRVKEARKVDEQTLYECFCVFVSQLLEKGEDSERRSKRKHSRRSPSPSSSSSSSSSSRSESASPSPSRSKKMKKKSAKYEKRGKKKHKHSRS